MDPHRTLAGRTVTATRASLLGVGLLLLLAGCGGNSGNRNSLTANDNPYQGSYSGTYATSDGLSDSGTLSLEISGNGKITGTATSLTNGASGAFLGSVSDSGTLAATIPYATQTTLQMGGTVTRPTSDAIGGSLTARSGGTTGTLTLSLTRNP